MSHLRGWWWVSCNRLSFRCFQRWYLRYSPWRETKQKETCLPENKTTFGRPPGKDEQSCGEFGLGKVLKTLCKIASSCLGALSGACTESEGNPRGPSCPQPGEMAELSHKEVHGVCAQSRRDYERNFFSQEGFTELPPHTKLHWETPSQGSVRTLLRLLSLKLLWEQLQVGLKAAALWVFRMKISAVLWVAAQLSEKPSVLV